MFRFQRSFSILPYLLLLLSATFLPTPLLSASPSTPTPDVIIIGAGLAAAKLAHDLARRNVTFTILEATPAIGGRLKQHTITSRHTHGKRGPRVEAGANWVQGFVPGDAFSDLVANRIRLRMARPFFDDVYFVRNGTLVPDAAADPVWERAERAMRKVYSLFNDSRDGDGNVLFDMSLQAALAFAAGWTPRSQMEVAAMRVEIDFEYALPAAEFSLQGLSPYYDPGARPRRRDLFVTDRRGFVEVVRWHLRRAGVRDLENGDGARLLLNAPVTDVRYGGGEEGVRVRLRDGRVVEGRVVVSTVSLGVLQYSLLREDAREGGANATKDNYLRFRPRLSARKRMAIAKFELADYMKLFLKFRRPVFTKSDPAFFLPLRCGGESGFISLQNLEKRGYYPGENMVLLTATNAFSRVLLCMSEAERMREALEYVAIATGRRMFWWEVEAMYAPGWFADVYTRGSYSTRKPGFTEQDVEALVRREGKLFFAGEAHGIPLSGYVQGAWESGARTAREVVRFLRGGR